MVMITIDETNLPQLVMVRRHLPDLPAINLPPGYTCRSYLQGDARYWESIINEAFGGEHDFNRGMAGHLAFKPERVWFICHSGQPVATASAWLSPMCGDLCGYLHMVGVMKEHAGLGLGLQASLAALHQMIKEGRDHAILETDDFRIAAIKTYLKIDFVPLLTHESHEQRWTDIFKAIDRKPVFSDPRMIV